VDLDNPDQTIYLEIHKDCVYVFHEKYEAMGGLPIGSAGRAVVLLSGGIDSPVAAILAMKRGLKISCLHFSSPPYTNEQSLNKVKSLVKVLHKYDKDINFYDANFSDLQLTIHKQCDSRYEVTILRRMMIKYADILCKKIKSKVIVTGESLGQVASQTVEGMFVSNSATKNLILRPLIMMDKLDIIKDARNYQTYGISILPYEDCCVIFLPKSPITKPKLKDVIEQETKANFESILKEVDVVKYRHDDLYKSIVDDII
jgi:thiamine biosynthesis protein ThiI